MDTSPLKCDAPTVRRVSGTYYVLQSVVLQGHGGFGRIKVKGTTLPLEVPDNHVEVEVYYCGLNFTDNYVRLGIIRSDQFPVIMGSECAGVVVRVGSGVTDIKVKQRVLCLQMHGGLFRRFIHISRSNCFVIPDQMGMIEAVCLGFDFLVAHLCLFEVGKLKDTDRVFMQSVAGGVGTSMIQLARALRGDKVKIIGTAGEEKHDDVLFLGANRVFTHEEDYVKEIKQDYHGGVDIAINSNGGTDITKLLKLVKPFGRLINIGSNSTAIYPRSTVWGMVPPSWDTKHMAPGEILAHRKITGVNVADLMQAFPEKVEAIVKETFHLFCSKKIQTRVHKIVPFEQVTEGMKYMCTRENVGKVMMFIKHEAPKSPEVPAPLPVPSGEPCQEKEDAASSHEVPTMPVPHCSASSPLIVPSENPCHQRDESGSHHMDDGEECVSLAETDRRAAGEERERRECCLPEEDLGIESDMEEEEVENEQEGEDIEAQGEEEEEESEDKGEQKNKEMGEEREQGEEEEEESEDEESEEEEEEESEEDEELEDEEEEEEEYYDTDQ